MPEVEIIGNCQEEGISTLASLIALAYLRHRVGSRRVVPVTDEESSRCVDKDFPPSLDLWGDESVNGSAPPVVRCGAAGS